jgi:hypothetical protein
MWTEGLGHLEISKNPTRNWTWDLPTCGAMPQPTAPLVTPLEKELLKNHFLISKLRHHLSKNRKHCAGITQISNIRAEDCLLGCYTVCNSTDTDASNNCNAFKTSVNMYQLTKHNIPELNLQQHCYEDIKFHTILTAVTTWEKTKCLC